MFSAHVQNFAATLHTMRLVSDTFAFGTVGGDSIEY
jgi:hypothetical protein